MIHVIALNVNDRVDEMSEKGLARFDMVKLSNNGLISNLCVSCFDS